ncbi:MAG: hypothetical protein N3A60_12670, partial [Thermanaerothrix sp.]|nr:hypothetical protein [Thermanaerothrix sp.]
SWKRVGIAFLVTLVMVGSGLGAFGRGLGATITGLVEFLRGWASGSTSLGVMGLAVFVYQPLGWILAIGQWVKRWRHL